MSMLTAYRRTEAPSGWTRIDTVLALYDGALDRLDRADKALLARDEVAAAVQLGKAQLIVSELAAGVRLDANEETGANLLRLYEYAVHHIRKPDPKGIAAARSVLQTLREGFAAVRVEANAFERGTNLPADVHGQIVHAMA